MKKVSLYSYKPKARTPIEGARLQYRPCMTTSSPIDALTPRVEQLLEQFQQLQRAHSDLQAQLEAVTQERDSLRLRLQAARARVDELIARLPVNQERP